MADPATDVQTVTIIESLAALATPIDQLVFLPGNPRRGDVEAVARSLKRFGQRKPVTANRDGTVTAGNHTLAAARLLGWTEIAVAWTDDDDVEAKAWALADNHTGELGTYDEVDLAAMLAEVQAADADLYAATSWTDQDLNDLLASLNPKGAPADLLTDPDDVPEPPVPTTKPGDVWVMGAHRVMCGNSTSADDVSTLMAGEPAVAVWTDPPYGVSYVGKTADALTIDNDGADEFEPILCGAFDQILAVCAPGAAVYVAAPAGPAGIPFARELHTRGMFRQRLVWVKSTLVLGHSDYHYRHEDLYAGYVPGYQGRRGRGGEGWYGDNSQTSVLEFPKPARSEDHPTMKPVDLVAYCLRNSATSGDIVLDLFGGSGTTLIAAQMLGLQARLMELDKVYVDVICRRFQEATGIVPVLESTGKPHDFTTG